MPTIDLEALSTKYQCDCAIPGEYVPPNMHDAGTCELYLCDEWIEGWVEWDNVQRIFHYPDLSSPLDDDFVLDVDEVLDGFVNDPAAVETDDDDAAFMEWWRAKNAEVTNANATVTTHASSSGKSWKSWKMCSHEQTPVAFPDGTTVYCHSVRENRDFVPDFALYMDAAQCYDAECIAYYLPWQDWGLPSIDWELADGLIEEVFELAKAGHFIETGCYGAHGRTGVVLGCMAILAGVDPDEAVKWVRTNYCTHAVEGADQAWYVRRFGALKRGLPVPERPPQPKPKPKAEAKDPGAVTLPKDLPAKKGKKRRNRKRGRRRR